MSNKNKVMVGNIRITSKPIGFLSGSENTKSKEDIVIFEENLNCALDKDEVEVEIIGRDRDRYKGRVLRVLKRNKTKFVGTIEKKGDSFIFIPDDYKFYKVVELKIVPQNTISGSKALVSIEWNNPNLNPKGEILEIIGKKGEHETEMQSILLDKGIIYNFKGEIEKEAEEIALQYDRDIELKIFNDRRDFRSITTFTIDPTDAKDFDDALSYENLGNEKIRVGVHIADVSHFVQENTTLDKEARKRNFSVYLVDRTIPMLPEILSNNLCSLMPNVDRLAFSAVFDIEKNTGKILERWFGKTIIHSNKRFSYEEAQTILKSKNKDHELWQKNYGEELEWLNQIANIYREQNKKNGAIEFETDEIKFELDEKGKPIRIYKKPRLDTMKMIEEWMLLANKEVAKFINDKIKIQGGASIFRIHDNPKIEKIENLAIFVRALGHELNIKNGKTSAKDINILLQKIEGHSSESLIKTAMIRSMAKAIYSTKNIGHFGLAFDYYTHFTSPIRRYPDLLIHRILENYLKGKKINNNEIIKFQKISEEASEKEIVVAEAERESIKYKQVEFMQDKVGQTFDCVISGVTEWGIYVENPETKTEGMVRLKNIDGDFFELDEKNYCVVGQKTKKKYSLGDSVCAKLISADLERKIMDFKLI